MTNSVDQVLSAVGTKAMKIPCKIATVANITLSGEQSINGVAIVAGDRVLVKDQTDNKQNGIYVCSTGTWTRAIDFNDNSDVVCGSFVTVKDYGVTSPSLHRTYYLNVTEPIVIGTSEITFTEVFGSFSLAGLPDVNFTSAAQGDIIYRNATEYVNLAAGASGRHLKMNLAGNAPEWGIPPGFDASVADYGAFGVDDSVVFQAAIDAMSSSLGGVLYVPAGNYTINTMLTVTKAAFAQGSIHIKMHPRAVITLGSGASGFIKFSGTSETDVLTYCTISGGQINATTDGAPNGVIFENALYCQILDIKFFGFKSTSRASSHAAVKATYSPYMNYHRVFINQCDIGFKMEGNVANTYRQTSQNVMSCGFKTCWRAIHTTDVIGLNVGGVTTIENSSIGLYMTFSRTSGINNTAFSIIGNYFERCGLHIKVISSASTAVSYGGVIFGNFFENVNTTYSDTTAFEDAGSGDHKLDIDGKFCHIGPNSWSTSSTLDEITFSTGSEGCVVEKQGNISGSVGIENQGSKHDFRITPTTIPGFTDLDTTPSVSGWKVYHCTNSAATTITNFDGAYAGQEFIVIFKNGNTTIDFSGTNLKGNSNVDRAMATNEALRVTFDGTNHYCSLID